MNVDKLDAWFYKKANQEIITFDGKAVKFDFFPFIIYRWSFILKSHYL